MELTLPQCSASNFSICSAEVVWAARVGRWPECEDGPCGVTDDAAVPVSLAG